MVGDRLLGFVGELEIDALWKLGAGDCEFCRRKGDCRTLPVSEAAGERVEARKDDCQEGGVSGCNGRSDSDTYHICYYYLVTVVLQQCLAQSFGIQCLGLSSAQAESVCQQSSQRGNATSAERPCRGSDG